jgi:putative ABC transport system permease protein
LVKKIRWISDKPAVLLKNAAGLPANMLLNSLWQDCRYGWRGLRKQPGFALLAIAALALGIGSATAIFSVIDNVLLDPFPYAEAQRLVVIHVRDLAHRGLSDREFFQLPEFLDYQEQNRVFDQVFGTEDVDVLYTGGEGTECFFGDMVTPNAFPILGVPALLGRAITPDDGKPGAPAVFVISYKTWLRNYDRDPSVLGRRMVLNGRPRTLVGIMPPRFAHRGADLWMPVTLDRGDPDLRYRNFAMNARLKPGVTPQQAEADLQVIARRLAQVYPQRYPAQFAIQVDTLAESTVSHFRKILFTLSAAVGFLLLIACSNVANMLLVRASAREKEMAIRASLGASRWRLVRQLLLEGLLLALGGAAAGCLVAYGGIKAIVETMPPGLIPDEAVIRVNVPVLLFSLGVAVVTAILFGLGPAMQAARPDIVEPLKDSGRGVTGGFRQGRLRNTLVVIEVAISLVLLVGAGLLMRSFIVLEDEQLGLNPDNLLVVRLPLPGAQHASAATNQHFFQPLLRRLYALPGVVAATEISWLPPYGGIPTGVEIMGKTHPGKWDAIFQLCSEGYFHTLDIRFLRGRALSEAEVSDARKVAVVNQTLVKKYFGMEDPIGRQIKLTALEAGLDSPVPNPVFEIVGVVADVKNQGIKEPPLPEVFVPYTVTGSFQRGILVRTSQNPLLLVNAARREIWAVDRSVALTLIGTLKDYLKRYSYAEPRFSLVLLGVFASVGLVLVAIGVYSVVAFTVSQQTHAIGIRMALGAGRVDVLRMVLQMGGRLIGLGAVAGVAFSFAVTRLLASQLWGVSPHDPITLAGVVLVVSLAGLAACYFPARKATRVDPMVALRHQ